jgi:hypothetical protein
MKTIEIKVYRFDELSEKAKEKAKESFGYDNPWENEIAESMRLAGGIYDEINKSDLSGLRLYKWIVNNILPDLTAQKKYYVSNGSYNSYFSVKRKIYAGEKARFSKIIKEIDALHLTGVCFDYDFLEPLFDFLRNPIGDLSHVDVYYICDRIVEKEREYFFMDANFSEHCDINGIMFYENGKMY